MPQSLIPLPIHHMHRNMTSRPGCNVRYNNNGTLKQPLIKHFDCSHANIRSIEDGIFP